MPSKFRLSRLRKLNQWSSPKYTLPPLSLSLSVPLTLLLHSQTNPCSRVPFSVPPPPPLPPSPLRPRLVRLPPPPRPSPTNLHNFGCNPCRPSQLHRDAESVAIVRRVIGRRLRSFRQPTFTISDFGSDHASPISPRPPRITPRFLFTRLTTDRSSVVHSRGSWRAKARLLL